MGKVMKIPRILGTLIIVAVVVAALSGVMLLQNVFADELEGSFDSTNGSSIFVDGQEILINGDTEWEGGTLADLAPGTTVEIKYVVDGDDNLVALEVEIEVEDDEDTDEDNDDDEDFELEGLVQSYTPGASITIDGQTFLIDGDTEIEGTPVVDVTIVEVEYEYVEIDGSLVAVALEIEVEDDEDTDEDNDDDEDFELEGLVQSYTPGASITIDGQTFLIDGDTEIEGTPVVDVTIVEVEYEYVEIDGSLVAVALEIEVEDDEDTEGDGDD